MKTLVEIIKEHLKWKHQIFSLAKSDIVKTYSGAALGWLWAIIKPTITILVYWFAFSVGLRKGGDVAGYPRLLWITAGVIPWFFMSDMITQGANAIRKYKFLVTKMKYPVSTIPTFVGLAKFVIHLFLIGMTIIFFAVFGYMPDVYLLQLPLYMLAMLLFFIEWSLFASMLSAMSQDFFNLVKSMTTAVFWLSGILWDIGRIKNPTLQKVLMFNPVTFVATGYRNVFIYKVWIWDEPRALFSFLIVLIIMGILAIWSYKKLIREIPDVL